MITFITTTCAIALLHHFPCHEALAIAELESSFNTHAVGSVGEQGAWQIRPEYHGKVSKNLTLQAKQAIILLASVRARCYPTLTDGWYICWNRGVVGGKRRGRGTAYEARAARLASKWKEVLRKTKHVPLTPQLLSSSGIQDFSNTKTLVQAQGE